MVFPSGWKFGVFAGDADGAPLTLYEAERETRESRLTVCADLRKSVTFGHATILLLWLEVCFVASDFSDGFSWR